MSKPSVARGTRDFSPTVMIRRNFIFDTIKQTFQGFGFLPIETPAIENLSTLMGKYGDEGDQLLFKILNSGNFSEKLAQTDLDEGYKKLTQKISEKGLRYDLTVPFARFVAMHRNELAFPFKRYQIQPVWRADRPQKGRYREFYQCDADVVGTNSLLCEAEIVWMLHEILPKLGIQNFVVKINNRKVLSGIAETIGAIGQETRLCVAIDKLDKIGKEAVEKELKEGGFSNENIEKLQPIFQLSGNDFQGLQDWIGDSKIGKKGIEELQEVWQLVEHIGIENPKIALDISLARGLSYYTGAIFEVKALGVNIGSISGGGRYDNLTDTFGLTGVSGVGISLGVDRIYDVMEELKLFKELTHANTQVLLTNFDKESEKHCLPILKKLRAANIRAELYPEASKLKKQFEYADKKQIPYMLIVGENELRTQLYTLKDMQTGEQKMLSLQEILEILKWM